MRRQGRNRDGSQAISRVGRSVPARPHSAVSRALAQGKPLKIGIMNDLSVPYSGDQGVGSQDRRRHGDFRMGLEARRAGRDDHRRPSEQTRRRPASRAAGSTTRASTSSWTCRIRRSRWPCFPSPTEEQGGHRIGRGSSVLTGPMCSKNFVHWTYDTYVFGNVLGKALTGEGKTWYFITADYAFGKDLELNCANAVTAAGGKVLGARAIR